MLHRVHVIENIIPAFRRKWPERRPGPISLTLLAVQKGALTKLPGRCSPLRSATGRIWPTSTPENESDTALSVCTHIYYTLQPLHVNHQIHKLLLKHTFIHSYRQKAQGVGTHNEVEIHSHLLGLSMTMSGAHPNPQLTIPKQRRRTKTRYSNWACIAVETCFRISNSIYVCMHEYNWHCTVINVKSCIYLIAKLTCFPSKSTSTLCSTWFGWCKCLS